MDDGTGCAVPIQLFTGGSMSLNPVGRIGGAGHPSFLQPSRNFHRHQKPAIRAIYGGDVAAMFLDGLECDRQPEA